MYEVVIQLGAIIAVLLLFFKKLWPFQNNSANLGITRYVKTDSINLWVKVLIASLPAAIIGLPLDDFLDTHLYNKTTVSITLILYGILFIFVERYNKNRKPKIATTSGITFKTAALIGCFQMLALIPGTSRSGATILGAILIGLSRPAAAEFSFFLAIPTMVGASLLKILKFLGEASFSGGELAILIVGMLVSFVVSVLAIRALMAYVKKKDFSFFGYYRIALGLLVLAFVVL
jgi:undecaprenyl-diphosphatase